MENKLVKLVNPKFEIEFMGKTYSIRKATLDKAVQYQQKIKEIEKDPAADAKLVAYCLWIMLKDEEPELTEDTVFKNIPADINPLEILTTLGFMNPSNLEMIKKVQEALDNKSTTPRSSQS